MIYKLFENKIEVYDLSQFNIDHILLCGQVFTFEKCEGFYKVFSKDKMAKVYLKDDKYIIETDSPNYFENYFDLKTDYSKIKQTLLNNHSFLKEIIEFGSGIRILKQDKLETIISFILSANNNISRIKNSMKYIRENAGENKGEYFAFPSLEKLSTLNEDFFKKAGAGYRSNQLVKAIKQLQNFDLEKLDDLPTLSLREKLLSLCGVGGKVADCILLFAYSRQDVFPVDTWIEKIYHQHFDEQENNRVKMREILLNLFKNLSGYAQQYLFFYKREEWFFKWKME